MLTRAWADVSLRDVTIVRDETGDGVRVTSRTGSAQSFVGELKESEKSLKLDAERGGSTFASSPKQAKLRAVGAARDGGQMN